MADPREKSRRFLKKFFDEEILFFSNADLQYKTWVSDQASNYALRIDLAHVRWCAIREEPQLYDLKKSQIKTIQALFDMLEAFHWKFNPPLLPSTPRDYKKLLNDPEWKKIQRQGRLTYADGYPVEDQGEFS